MKIHCDHGYFKFFERNVGDVSRFMSLFGFDLVRVGDYYTFSTLESAPLHSVAGNTYLGATALVSFEGSPSEVMRENTLVYDFINDSLVQIATITRQFEAYQAANYYLSSGLILPGSIKKDGSRVTDYAAWYLFDTAKFKYSEVIYG